MFAAITNNAPVEDQSDQDQALVISMLRDMAQLMVEAEKGLILFRAMNMSEEAAASIKRVTYFVRYPLLRLTSAQHGLADLFLLLCSSPCTSGPVDASKAAGSSSSDQETSSRSEATRKSSLATLAT